MSETGIVPRTLPKNLKELGIPWKRRYHDRVEGCIAGYVRESPEVPEPSLNNTIIKQKLLSLLFTADVQYKTSLLQKERKGEKKNNNNNK